MHNQQSFITSPGKPEPYGISLQENGTNFALYSEKAVQATLLLYSYPETQLITEVPLDPSLNRTGSVWHVTIADLPNQTAYAWHLETQGQPDFCKTSTLLDPYAKGVISPVAWKEENKPYTTLGAVIANHPFDWEEDKLPQIALEDLVIYEMHIRGWTKDPSSGVSHPGTFLGAIEKIPHLVDLGVNAVKLMPLQEFNEAEYSRFNPNTGEKLCNYWGYSTVNYFSPMNRYASQEGFGQALTDFKTLVKAFHQHGIEVILDVVFNHTAEGGETGPIYSFKGINCGLYYLMGGEQKFLNFTGCGNTVNCNHPVVREWIRHCLKYWVTEMHVDGFRFDLAAIFMRGIHGEPLNNSPLIEELSNDPVLASTKLIAEPWDSGGLYKLGDFYSNTFRWLEWNDQYRDSVRRFLKGDRGEKKEFARRLSGSEDIFWSKGSPLASINFITAHDGFTLRDLVSYNQKNNSANGENDRDGNPHNVSWNCGAEGATTNPHIEQLRDKQRRNFLAALFLSQGVPMVLMGDEYGHTRGGNNNSWCQDNRLNWFCWDLLEKDASFTRFFKKLVAFRKNHSILRRAQFLNETVIDWHGEFPFNVDWEGDSSCLGFTLKESKYRLFAAFNPSHEPLLLKVPSPEQENVEELKDEKGNKKWRWVFNTANIPPEDFYEEETAPFLENLEYEMASYSALLLKCEEGAGCRPD